MTFSITYAQEQDRNDPLAHFRHQFIFPQRKGKNSLYFTGNSLGLQPKTAAKYVNETLEDWAKLGVEGHFKAKHPWYPYHEFVTEGLAHVVGAQAKEVVAMNSLTVNLHLLMLSFYRPTKERNKILMEAGAFPSDQYALFSQVKMHGFEPDQSIVEIAPRPGEHAIRDEDILKKIDELGSTLALVLFGNVNFLTAQAFPIKAMAQAAHKVGAICGLDLAHGAGSLDLKLHESDCDFAAWCSYKYLNAGPGAIAGIFVHERHAKNFDLPRLAGWWGHSKTDRFKMERSLKLMEGAEGWQISNPPILQLAALRSSLEIFLAAGISNLREKSEKLMAFLELSLREIAQDKITIVTPTEKHRRGSHLALKFKSDAETLSKKLAEEGVICDFRQPDIMRVAMAPLYTSFEDVFHFANVVKKFL